MRAFGTAKTNTTHAIPRPSAADKPLKATRAPLTAKPLHKPTSAGVTKHRPSDRMNLGQQLSSANIADIVEKKVEEILAARALNESVKPISPDASDEVNKRLELLEKKLEKKADARAEGLTYILLAKQHVARGENFPALKMYELALTYFPENGKLLKKINDLRGKKSPPTTTTTMSSRSEESSMMDGRMSVIRQQTYTKEETFGAPSRPKLTKAFAVFTDNDHADAAGEWEEDEDQMDTDYVQDVHQTPRTQTLLKIINSEDVAQIMKLKVCSPFPLCHE